MKIGFFYSVFKEKRAVDFSIQQLRLHYPDSKIYLVSDGGLDFSYLHQFYSNILTSVEEDTMSETFKITSGVYGNFKELYYQNVIKKCAYAVLNRMERAIIYCENPDWMVMCDPDCLIRGKLNFPADGKILGSRVNCFLPNGYKSILSKIDGAIPIDRWGASPCIFEVKTFQRALAKFKFLDKKQNLLDNLCKEFHAMYAHDVLFPTIFALIGEEEVLNTDLIECGRDPSWPFTQHPLVHQFEEYYDK